MATIIVEHPKNELLKRHIHTLHQIDLYQGYLYNKISTIEYESSDTLKELLGKSYSNWAAEELLRLGVISIYHFWEKSIVSLLKQQSDLQNIQLPQRGRRSLVHWVKVTLDQCFTTLENDSVWRNLDELRVVANTIKHADPNKYKELSLLHPKYFMMTSRDHVDDVNEYENRFFIGIANFTQVVSSAAAFWDALPHKVIYAR